MASNFRSSVFCSLERPLDLTTLTTDIIKITARKELWQLKTEYAAWLEEWKQLQLSEVTY